MLLHLFICNAVTNKQKEMIDYTPTRNLCARKELRRTLRRGPLAVRLLVLATRLLVSLFWGSLFHRYS